MSWYNKHLYFVNNCNNNHNNNNNHPNTSTRLASHKAVISNSF